MLRDLYMPPTWIPDFIHDTYRRLWEGTVFPEAPVIAAKLYGNAPNVDIEAREIESAARYYARGIKRYHATKMDRIALRRLVWLSIYAWLESDEYQYEIDRACCKTF